LVKRPLPLGDGMVARPTGPGLGIEVDEAAVARFSCRMG
jgi:L-alanine-DL-glutamate epimerase-like enolase superfamily enzyme